MCELIDHVEVIPASLDMETAWPEAFVGDPLTERRREPLVQQTPSEISMCAVSQKTSRELAPLLLGYPEN